MNSGETYSSKHLQPSANRARQTDPSGRGISQDEIDQLRSMGPLYGFAPFPNLDKFFAAVRQLEGREDSALCRRLFALVELHMNSTNHGEPDFLLAIRSKTIEAYESFIMHLAQEKSK